MIHLYQSSDITQQYYNLIQTYDLLNNNGSNALIVFPSNRWKSDFIDFLLEQNPEKAILDNSYFSYQSFLETVFHKIQAYDIKIENKIKISNILKTKIIDEIFQNLKPKLDYFAPNLNPKAKRHFIQKMEKTIHSLIMNGFSPESFKSYIRENDDLNKNKINDLSLYFSAIMDEVYSIFYDDVSLQYDIVRNINHDSINDIFQFQDNLIFYGFDKFNPLIMSILEKIQNLNIKIHIYLPGILNTLEMTHTKAQLNIYKTKMDFYFHEPSVKVKTIPDLFFDDFTTEEEEITQILFKIMSIHMETKMDLDRFAITYSNIDDKQYLIRQKCMEYQIPFNISASLKLKDNRLINHILIALKFICEGVDYLEIIQFAEFRDIDDKFNKASFVAECLAQKTYSGSDIISILKNYWKNEDEVLEHIQHINAHKIVSIDTIDEIIKNVLNKLSLTQIIDYFSKEDIEIAQNYSRALYSFYELIEQLNLSLKKMNNNELSFRDYVYFLVDEISEITYQIPEKKNYGIQILPFIECRSSRMDYLFIAGLNQSEFPNIKTGSSFFNSKEETLLNFDDYQLSIYEDIFLFQLLIRKKSKSIFLSSSTQNSEKDSPSYMLNELNLEDKSWKVDKNFKKQLPVYHFENVFDIDFPSDIGEKELKRELSSSRLQTYFDCSYKYFLNNILFIKDELEPELEVEQRDLGTFAHRILYEFHTTLNKTLDRSVEQQRKIMNTCIDNVLEEEQNKYTQNISNLLVDFIMISKESGIFDRYLEYFQNEVEDFSPTYFELNFNKNTNNRSLNHFKSDDYFIETEIGQVRFRGQIDRIDFNEKNKQFIVIDYKLKSSSNAKERTDFFSRQYLQIPIYLLILQNVIQNEYKLSDAQLIYLKSENNIVASTNTYKRKDVNYQEILDDYKTLINELVLNIAQNKFELNPRNEDICKYCDYTNVCHIKEKAE